METTTQIGHLRLRQLSPNNFKQNETAGTEDQPSSLSNTKNCNTLPRIEVIFYRVNEAQNFELAFENMNNCIPMTDAENDSDFVKVLEKTNFCVQNLIMRQTNESNNDDDAIAVEANRYNIVQQLIELNSGTRKLQTIISVLNDENPMKALAKILITPEFNTNTPQLQVKLSLRKIISLGRLCMRKDNLISVRISKNSSNTTTNGEILDLANLITTGTLVRHNQDEFITFCSCKRCLPYRQIVYHIMMEHFHVSHMVDSLLEVLVKAYYRIFKNKTAYQYFDHYMSSNRHVYWLSTGFYYNNRMDHMHFIYDKSITDNMIFVLFSTILLVNNPMLLLQILAYHIKCVLQAYCEGAVETSAPGEQPNSKVNAENLLKYVLDGYQEMGTISDGISTYFFTLEKVFLSKFNLTWRFLCERLYYQHVYVKLATKTEAAITLLKTKSLDENFLELNVRYLALENEMVNIKMKWPHVWLKMHHFNLSETERKRRRGFSDIHNTMSTMVEDSIVMEIPENKDERNFYEYLLSADPVNAWKNVLAFTKTKWPNGFYKPPNVIVCEDKCNNCQKLLNYHQQTCNCITCAIGGGPNIPKYSQGQLCQKCSLDAMKLENVEFNLNDLKTKEDLFELEKHAAYMEHEMRGEIPYHCAWILFKHLKYRKPYILPTLMDKFFCENCSQIPCRLARYIMTNKFSKELSQYLIDYYQPISMSREELRVLLPNIMRYNYRMIRTTDDNDTADACNNLVVKTYWTFLLSIYATYFIDTREEIPLDICSLYLKNKDVHFNIERLMGNRNDRRFDIFLQKLTLPKIPPPKRRTFNYAAYFESRDLEVKVDDIMKMSLYDMNSRTELELHLKEGTSKLRKSTGNNVSFTSIDVHQVLSNLNTESGEPADLPQPITPKFTPSERAIIQRELADNCKDFTGKKRLKKKSLKEFSQIRMNETRDRLRKKLTQLENSKKTRPSTPTPEMATSTEKSAPIPLTTTEQPPITIQPTANNENICGLFNSSASKACEIPPQRPVTPEGKQQPPTLKEAAAAAAQIDKLITGEISDENITTIPPICEKSTIKNEMKDLCDRMSMLGHLVEKPLPLKNEMTTKPISTTIPTIIPRTISSTTINKNNNNINNANNKNDKSTNNNKKRNIKNKLKTINVCSALMSNNNNGHKCDCYLRGEPRELSSSSSSSLSSLTSSYSSSLASVSNENPCKPSDECSNESPPDLVTHHAEGAVEYNKWINDTLNFIEGSSNDNSSPRKIDPKKAAKKAKQKLKKEEGKRISELQDLRDQFHDIFYKEYTDKEHLKQLKHSNDNKIRDKKIIHELEANVKKLHSAKGKLEQNILELIATVKQTNGEFKFAYLPSREQLFDKRKEHENQNILVDHQQQQQQQNSNNNVPQTLLPPIVNNTKVKLINPAFLVAGLPSISGETAAERTPLHYGAYNRGGMSSQMIYAPPPTLPKQKQPLINLPPLATDNNCHGQGSGDPGNRIVTIRRVAVPNVQEPQVSITRKGAPPSADDLVYTIVHGQFMPAQNLHQHNHQAQQLQQKQLLLIKEQHQHLQKLRKQEEERKFEEKRLSTRLDDLIKEKQSIDDGNLSKSQFKKIRKRLFKEHAKAAAEIDELEKQLELKRIENQKEKEYFIRIYKENEREIMAKTTATNININNNNNKLQQKPQDNNKNKKKNEVSSIPSSSSDNSLKNVPTIPTTTTILKESGSISPIMVSKSTNCIRDNSVNSNTLPKVLSRKQLKQQQKQLKKATQKDKLKQEEEEQLEEEEIQLNAQFKKDKKCLNNENSNTKNNNKSLNNNNKENKVKNHAASLQAPTLSVVVNEKKIKLRTKRSVIDNGQFDNNPYKYLHTNESDEFSSESEECNIIEENDIYVENEKIEQQQKNAILLVEKKSQNGKIKEKQNKKSNKKDIKTTTKTTKTTTNTQIANEAIEKKAATNRNTNSININNKEEKGNDIVKINQKSTVLDHLDPMAAKIKKSIDKKNKKKIDVQSQNTISPKTIATSTNTTASKQKIKSKEKITLQKKQPQEQQEPILEEVPEVSSIPTSRAELKKKRVEEARKKTKIQNNGARIEPFETTGAVKDIDHNIYGNPMAESYYDTQAPAVVQRQQSMFTQQQQQPQIYNQLAQQMQQLRLGNTGHTYDNNNSSTYTPLTASAVMSNNASIMDQLSRGVQVENLSLPPGITLTKVDPIKSEQLRRKSETIKKLSQPLQTHVAASQHGIWKQHPSATIIAPPVSTYMANTSPYIIPSNACAYNSNGIIMVESAQSAINQQIPQEQYQPTIITAAPTPTKPRTKTKSSKKNKTNAITTNLTNSIEEGANLTENSSKVKKSRKRRNKILKPELPLTTTASVDHTKMITLRNPMFHGGPTAASGATTPAIPLTQTQQNAASAIASTATAAAGNPLMGLLPQSLPTDQPAAIIKNENGMFTIRNPALHQAVSNGLAMSGYRQFGNVSYYTPQEAAFESVASTAITQTKVVVTPPAIATAGTATTATSSPFSYFSKNTTDVASTAKGSNNLHNNISISCTSIDTNAQTQHDMPTDLTSTLDSNTLPRHLSAIGSEMKSAQQQKQKTLDNGAASSSWMPRYLSGVTSSNYYNGMNAFTGVPGGCCGNNNNTNTGEMQSSSNSNNTLFFDMTKNNDCQMSHHNCGDDSPPPTITGFTSSYLDGIPNTGVIRYDDASFLKHLIPGRNLNNEVSIHNISEANYNRNTSPAVPHVELTQIYGRSPSTNLYEQAQQQRLQQKLLLEGREEQQTLSRNNSSNFADTLSTSFDPVSAFGAGSLLQANADSCGTVNAASGLGLSGLFNNKAKKSTENTTDNIQSTTTSSPYLFEANIQNTTINSNGWW